MARAPQGKNRRRAPRVRIANLVAYKDKRADQIFNVLGNATTVDLSETGLRLRTHEPLPIGTILSFDLQLGGDLASLSGRIVWGEELEPDKSYEFGVNFVEMSAATQETLRLFVSLKAAKEND